MNYSSGYLRNLCDFVGLFPSVVLILGRHFWALLHEVLENYSASQERMLSLDYCTFDVLVVDDASSR